MAAPCFLWLSVWGTSLPRPFLTQHHHKHMLVDVRGEKPGPGQSSCADTLHVLVLDRAEGGDSGPSAESSKKEKNQEDKSAQTEKVVKTENKEDV